MQSNSQKELERFTLNWMVNTFSEEAIGSTRQCKCCRTGWLVCFGLSSLFVFLAHEYELVDVGGLILGAAIAGASLMAAGLMGQSAASMAIVGGYVDLEKARKGLDEINKT
jgi:hypothetical protein